MSFPVTIQGSYGDQFKTTAGKRLPLGSIMQLPGGEAFVYARAGALDLASGKLMQAPVVVTTHIKDLALAVAAAIGDTAISVTNSAVALTKDYYTEGYMFINDGAGESQTLKIKSNDADASGAATVVVTVEEGDALHTALVVATTKIGLRKHECDGVLVAPTTVTGPVVGVSVCPVTATYYCWLLKVGLQAVLTNGTVILGLAVDRSATTPGAVDVYPLNSVDTSGQQAMLGTVYSVGATTEYSLVKFNIV